MCLINFGNEVNQIMDRRIKYTKKVIKETLITLLNEKEINKITVSEICKIADINRATFYRYYLDVYDLLDKIKEEFVNELLIVSNNNKVDYTISSFSKELLSVFLDNKDLVKVLFNKKSDIYFLNDILEVAFEKCKNKWENKISNLSNDSIEYASIFIFNGALGVINFWIQNDFEKSIDEICTIIESLSYYGINQFIYKNRD